MAAERDHIMEIERVLAGAPSARDDVVVTSWKRCIDTHRLDPTRPAKAYIVPEVQLREHLEQSERLIAIARSGLENLFKQVAGQNYVLLLADAKGVTVDFLGDPKFMEQLRRAGLYLGADWSESRAGTCGVGSCIATGEAMTIHQTDHFDTTHTRLSCTAAPIFDTKGQLTAVLDISLLRSPQPKVSQNLALHLVTAAVRRIELANLMTQVRSDWVLRFSRSPEFLDVDPEAAVALDGSGRIIGMTHGGAQLLTSMAGRQRLAAHDIIGQPISSFLDVSIDDLPTLTRARPAEDRLLYGRDGSASFAHAIEPNPGRYGRAATTVVPKPIRALSGGDAEMAAVQERAAKLAATDIPILLQGETGTGKEYLARAIHESVARDGPFVAVNCAAIPEHLIESELFGHMPGAFTGAAARARKGLIETADGGTLFLDEIGDMPYALQSRLLRVINEREVIPVGATRPRPVRIKVISASHRNLRNLVAEEVFREDLYFRLNAATLTLPPLRSRSDFEWVVERVLAERQQRTGSTAKLSSGARLALIRHSWPGNIRELANVLDVALALCDGVEIQPPDLAELVSGQTPPPVQISLRPTSAADERESLATVIADCGGNISEAARRLGVDRTTVHRRMKRFSLKATD